MPISAKNCIFGKKVKNDMLGFSPFKKHANKFNYTPRYYDPDLEAFRERRAEKGEQAAEEKGENVYVAGEFIRRRREARNEQRRQEDSARKTRGMIRMLVVIVVVAIMIFVVVPRVAEMFDMAKQNTAVQSAPTEEEFDPYRPIRVVPNDYQGE